MSFYGGRNGIDYVCFDNRMMVVASGTLDSMIALAEKNNYAVGQLQAVRYIKPEQDKPLSVTYDGHYPAACMGTLIVKRGDETIYSKQYCCYVDGGGCYHDDNWNWTVEDGKLMWCEEDAEQFNADIRKAVQDVLDDVSVCCGGCI